LGTGGQCSKEIPCGPRVVQRPNLISSCLTLTLRGRHKNPGGRLSWGRSRLLLPVLMPAASSRCRTDLAQHPRRFFHSARHCVACLVQEGLMASTHGGPPAMPRLLCRGTERSTTTFNAECVIRDKVSLGSTTISDQCLQLRLLTRASIHRTHLSPKQELL